ncbi:PREDICTED: uncharacterized protein LOC105455881 [Wasmannia auropunctata]|uniref:uncharacterized protein LOC105455881 n=1 Tax=Wasmannia auropunctata TaxID=64793 RepID=UPI0005EFABD9|nr:PREDICTED: uncharacterized protein LOC105455881 [Wasmannia auropunctata]
MKTAWILSLVVSPLLVLGSPPGTIREGGIKIGTGRGTVPKGTSVGRGNSAVRIGEGGRLSNSTRQRSFPTTTTTTITPTRFTPQSSVNNSGNNYNITDLKVGMLVPYKSFGVREYTRAVTTAINTLQRSTRGPKLGLFQRYDLHVKIAMKELTPSPTVFGIVPDSRSERKVSNRFEPISLETLGGFYGDLAFIRQNLNVGTIPTIPSFY